MLGAIYNHFPGFALVEMTLIEDNGIEKKYVNDGRIIAYRDNIEELQIYADLHNITIV